MTKAPSLLQSRTIEVYPEDINIYDGELKTRNVPSTQPQRPQVTYRGIGMGSDDKIDVQLVLCAHGWSCTEDEAASGAKKRERRTLIVVEYRVHRTVERKGGENTQIRSVKTDWKFFDADRKAEGPAYPEVVAIAPWHESRWQRTTGEVEKTRYKELLVGVEKEGKAEGKIGSSRTHRHEQEYFDSGRGYTEYNNKLGLRASAGWFLQQNSSQKLGVEPHFCTAILLRRRSDAPFKGQFSIRLGDGPWASWILWARETLGTPIDDPENFDPTRKPEGKLWDKYKDKVSLDSLDSLAVGEHLEHLVEFWEEGMRPFKQFRGQKEEDDDDDE